MCGASQATLHLSATFLRPSFRSDFPLPLCITHLWRAKQSASPQNRTVMMSNAVALHFLPCDGDALLRFHVLRLHDDVVLEYLALGQGHRRGRPLKATHGAPDTTAGTGNAQSNVLSAFTCLPSNLFSSLDQGSFHGRRWLVWLFPLTYPSYRVLLMSRESAKCSFLKKKFFYNNSPIYSNNLIASKKLVTWHPLGRHIPIPYSSWTETYQKNHLSKKNSIFWLIYRGNV